LPSPAVSLSSTHRMRTHPARRERTALRPPTTFGTSAEGSPAVWPHLGSRKPSTPSPHSKVSSPSTISAGGSAKAKSRPSPMLSARSLQQISSRS
jgi:hypothetical protein